MTVYTANGTLVEECGICARCGSPIKYIYAYNGKTYGSTCIEAVSGIRPDDWAWKDGRYDEDATKQSLAEKEATRQARAQAETELIQKRETVRETNRTRYAELISVLNSASRSQGDFCSEIARIIANDGFSTELVDILNMRQWYIVREIWSKQYGRSNSKAYNAGIAEFDERFCGQVENPI